MIVFCSLYLIFLKSTVTPHSHFYVACRVLVVRPLYLQIPRKRQIDLPPLTVLDNLKRRYIDEIDFSRKTIEWIYHFNGCAFDRTPLPTPTYPLHPLPQRFVCYYYCYLYSIHFINFLPNITTQVIHGDIGQNSRQQIIKQFKEGIVDVLVATDVAARGLDIEGVDLVVHASPPMDPDTFVHRSGRTGRAGRNGTSVLLYKDEERRKLYMFESGLKFKFTHAGPPSAAEVSKACATFASKRLEKVTKKTVKHFLPHAKRIINEVLNADEEVTDEGDEVDDTNDEGDSAIMERLLAKCIAAISNRQEISERSLLTGEEGVKTIQFEAVFRNGSTPESVRDWQRLVNGILRRSLGVEDAKFGKISMARSSTRNNLCVLVDFTCEQADTILSALNDDEVKIPGGVKIHECHQLPPLVQEARRDYAGNRYEGVGYGRSGGGRDRYGGSGRYGGRAYHGNGDGGGRGRRSNDYQSRSRRVYTSSGPRGR